MSRRSSGWSRRGSGEGCDSGSAASRTSFHRVSVSPPAAAASVGSVSRAPSSAATSGPSDSTPISVTTGRDSRLGVGNSSGSVSSKASGRTLRGRPRDGGAWRRCVAAGGRLLAAGVWDASGVGCFSAAWGSMGDRGSTSERGVEPPIPTVGVAASRTTLIGTWVPVATAGFRAMTGSLTTTCLFIDAVFLCHPRRSGGRRFPAGRPLAIGGLPEPRSLVGQSLLGSRLLPSNELLLRDRPLLRRQLPPRRRLLLRTRFAPGGRLSSWRRPSLPHQSL